LPRYVSPPILRVQRCEHHSEHRDGKSNACRGRKRDPPTPARRGFGPRAVRNTVHKHADDRAEDGSLPDLSKPYHRVAKTTVRAHVLPVLPSFRNHRAPQLFNFRCLEAAAATIDFACELPELAR
jgi:hypothetical protein